MIWTVIGRYIGDKSKSVHQVIGIAVDEVLHASARYNTLDNISVVMIAFEPLIQLFENHRNPQKMMNNQSISALNQYSNVEIAQG